MNELEPGVELELVGARTPVTLFGRAPAGEFLEYAGEYANALKAMLTGAGLIVRLDGREYVKAEGWTALGSMLGVFPVVESVDRLELERDGQAEGFRARARAVTRAGEVVGAAEAICSRDEPNWNERKGKRVADYALASMAQTRAVAKALRMPLGFIIAMAGYSATPAEEMDSASEPVVDADTAGAVSTGAAAPAGSPVPRARDHQIVALVKLSDDLAEVGRLPRDELAKGMESRYGTTVFADLTNEQAHDLIERLADLAAAHAAAEAAADLGPEAP